MAVDGKCPLLNFEGGGNPNPLPPPLRMPVMGSIRGLRLEFENSPSFWLETKPRKLFFIFYFDFEEEKKKK